MKLFLLVILPLSAFAHVTDNERTIISNMRVWAVEQQATAHEAQAALDKAVGRAESATTSLTKFMSLADTMKQSLLTLQDQIEKEALRTAAVEQERDKSKLDEAEGKATILKLGIGLGVTWLGIAAFVFIKIYK